MCTLPSSYHDNAEKNVEGVTVIKSPLWHKGRLCSLCVRFNAPVTKDCTRPCQPSPIFNPPLPPPTHTHTHQCVMHVVLVKLNRPFQLRIIPGLYNISILHKMSNLSEIRSWKVKLHHVIECNWTKIQVGYRNDFFQLSGMSAANCAFIFEWKWKTVG